MFTAPLDVPGIEEATYRRDANWQRFGAPFERHFSPMIQQS
jgi:hypothetical protein